VTKHRAMKTEKSTAAEAKVKRLFLYVISGIGR
jgi:hypothetical protein